MPAIEPDTSTCQVSRSWDSWSACPMRYTGRHNTYRHCLARFGKLRNAKLKAKKEPAWNIDVSAG